MRRDSVPEKRTVFRRLAAAVAGMCFVTVLVLWLFSCLVSGEALPLTGLWIYATLSLFLGTMVGALIFASGMSGRRGIAIGVSGGGMMLILLMAGAATGWGSLSWAALGVHLAACLAGSITGCIITPGRRRVRRK